MSSLAFGPKPSRRRTTWSRLHWILLIAGIVIVVASLGLVVTRTLTTVSGVLSAPWLAGVGTIIGILAYISSFVSPFKVDKARPPVVMPIVPAGFVDRESAVTDIVDSLANDEVPVVAVQGIGGLGKSSVAAKAVSILHSRKAFPDGISWHSCNDMLGLDGWSRLLDEIALRFGGQESVRNSRFDQGQRQMTLQEKEVIVKDMLAGRRALLLLDNVEEQFPLERARQVLTVRGAREMGPDVLVTTRVHVPIPLVRWVDLSELPTQDAMTLFVERAREARRAFSVPPTEVPYVEQICSAVGNLPLGIELAAVLAADGTMSLGTLAAALSKGQRSDSEGLVTSRTSESFRQLLATFDASFNPLSESQRQSFAALSLFRGADFALIAAGSLCRAVAGTEPETDGMPSEALETLRRRSLIQVVSMADRSSPEANTSEQRIRLHPLLREYAQVQFDNLPLPVRKRAWEAYVDVCSARVKQQTNAMNLSPAEYVNVAHAITIASSNEMWPKVRDLCLRLAPYWYFRSQWHDGRAYLARGIEAARLIKDQRAEGLLMYEQARIVKELGDTDEAKDLLMRCLPLLEETSELRGQSAVLREIGRIAYDRGDYRSAAGYFERSLDLARAANDPRGIGSSLHELGVNSVSLKEWELGVNWLNQALEVRRAEGDVVGEGRTYHQFGRLLSRRADEVVEVGSSRRNAEKFRNQALEYLNKALAIGRSKADQRGLGRSYREMGHVLRMQRRFAEALKCFEQAISIQAEIGDQLGEVRTRSDLGEMYEAQRELARARAEFERALELAERVHAGEAAAIRRHLNNLSETR